MRKNVLLILSLFLLVFACQKDEDPYITINNKEDISISSDRDSETISFSTNMSWTAKSSASWCTLSQTRGDNTSKSITVNVTANDTYDARSCIVTITIEGMTKVVNVQQSQKDAILLSSKTQKVSSKSQTLEIELKTNVDLVIIPEDAKSWVSYTGTRALRSETLLFNIAANTDSEVRSAEIYVKNKATNMQETLTIIQSGVSLFTIIEGTNNKVQQIETSKDFVLQLNNLENKEVFFVFTNKNEKNSVVLPGLQSNVVTTSNAMKSINYDEPTSFMVSGKPSITKFNNNPPKLTESGVNKPQYQQQMASKPVKLEVGTSEDFFDDKGKPVKSTVRKVITAHGKTLYMWVADNCWGPSSTKTHHVTQTMIDAFAPKFLNPGDDNDIYEWVTNAAGNPYGPSKYTNLIPDTDDIHIWLTDIDDDNKTTGTITLGYYYARDNFVKATYEDSNEKLMFTIDAVLFGKTTNGGWSVTNYWPMEFISTLAHEFTHMIYFYQHNVLTGQEGYTAINEMSAQCVEDLVANKIKANGPRGVPYATSNAGSVGNKNGRIPLYNKNNNYDFMDWSENEDEALLNYSKTYTLGAYLMRNYGGAKFIKELIQNNSTGRSSIVAAINNNGGTARDYADVLQKFGAANLLSDQTTVEVGYKFNTGGWSTSTINGINYELGSINLYNYAPPPSIFNILPETQKPGSNILYRAGSNLNGTKEWQFNEMSSDTRLTVVIK